MSFDLKKMLVDEKKEKEGVRFDFGDTGAFLIAARPGNPNSVAEFAKLSKVSEKVFRFLPEKEKDKETKLIMGKVYFKTVFLNWEGLEIQGKPFEYNEKNCIALFMQPRYARFCVMLTDMVDKAEKNGDFSEVSLDAEETETVVKK